MRWLRYVPILLADVFMLVLAYFIHCLWSLFAYETALELVTMQTFFLMMALSLTAYLLPLVNAFVSLSLMAINFLTELAIILRHLPPVA